MSDDIDFDWNLTIENIRHRIPNAKSILARAVRLHIGWEMDNEVCVVELIDGSKVLVGTNHGGVYVEEPEGLRESMSTYRTALSQSEEVLRALGQST